jgi:type VI secretion system secreted protein VgrG
MSTPAASRSATQAHCFLSVTTPLGANMLLLDGCAGREAISELFQFELRMRSTNKALDFSTVVGATATVTLQTQSGPARYLSGIVTRFASVGSDMQYGHYTATLAPQLWSATLGRDRAIYQNKSVPDIVKAVLGTFNVSFEEKLTGSYPVRDYCVQYDESAFQFISRLMEDEGIFYFFDFADGTHTMVLADSTSAHLKGAHSATLYCAGIAGVAPTIERLDTFEVAQALVAGDHVLADYDFVAASTSQAQKQTSASGASAGADLVRYTFPGKYADAADGTRKATIRLAAHTAGQQTGHGSGRCYSLAAGTFFTLAAHANAALNVDYVVRSVMHDATNDAYHNAFEIFPYSVPFRAPIVTPLPVVNGTHTAKVTGSSGEEIWTDSYGRVKVKFHWDRSSTANEETSCWIRVSQAWAGQGWGQFVLPRIGQEVIVSYIDGDPDRPLVTGCVFNGVNTTPIALPGSQTQSVLRSRSSKNGQAGNEIRMEDKLDAEELYLHAQKDMNVAIENALTTTVIGGAQSLVVQKGDRTLDVQTGKETYTVKGTRTLDITGDETHTNHGKFTQTTGGDYTLKITGNLTIEASGTVSIKSGTSFANEAGTSLGLKAGTSLTAQGTTVEHKASAAQTVDGGGMLALKGGVVKLN